MIHMSYFLPPPLPPPSSGESLSHVNYNLEVTDAEGNPVESITDLHIHRQEMTFRT